MPKNELERKAEMLEKAYGRLEELFYSWERYDERELFGELAKRCRAYLEAYNDWVNHKRRLKPHAPPKMPPPAPQTDPLQEA